MNDRDRTNRLQDQNNYASSQPAAAVSAGQHGGFSIQRLAGAHAQRSAQANVDGSPRMRAQRKILEGYAAPASLAGSAGAVRQLRLPMSADEFDLDTTETKPGIFVDTTLSLTEVVKAIRAYEGNETLANLHKIAKACSAAGKSATLTQRTKILILESELRKEALRLLPDDLLSRLGSTPTDVLARSTRDGNTCIDLGVSNLEHASLVDDIVVPMVNAGALFQQFLGTSPGADISESAFISGFRIYLQNLRKRITPGVLTSLDAEIKRARQLIPGRENDKRTLRGLMDVSEGAAADIPNRMNSAEFSRIAAMYSAIREGTSNVGFLNRSRTGAQTFGDNTMDGPGFSNFQESAMRDLAQILRTPEGRTLISDLHAGGKKGTSRVMIGGVSDPLLAGAVSDDDTMATDGRGTGGKVYYRPGTDVPAKLTSGDLYTTSDTALFHELTHAHHFENGTIKPSKDLVSFGETRSLYDLSTRVEEYATVGLGSYATDKLTENAYRASHRTLAGPDTIRRDRYLYRPTYR